MNDINKMDKRTLHDRVVDGLVARLKTKFPEERVYDYMEYKDGNRIVGEADILRYPKRDYAIMYEIKTGEDNYKKAQEQFRRFQLHHPSIRVKGIYVHPEYGVRRLR